MSRGVITKEQRLTTVIYYFDVNGKTVAREYDIPGWRIPTHLYLKRFAREYPTVNPRPVSAEYKCEYKRRFTMPNTTFIEMCKQLEKEMQKGAINYE